MTINKTIALAYLIAAISWSPSFGNSQAYPVMAGYQPDSNVTQHSLIDLDVRDIDDETDEPDFTAAMDIYTNGRHSSKTTSLRKLKDFSIQAPTLMAGQPFFEVYKAYWQSGTYADDFVQAAAAGTGDFAEVEDVSRREGILKGIQYQVIWMYVIREMEDAIDDCEASNATNNDASVLAWDEAWAFYAGSLEGENGTDSGYLGYALAEKRCDQFKTCESGRTKVNQEMLGLFAQGQVLLRAGACAQAAEVIPRIVSRMTVPLIQGALRYVHRGSTNDLWGGTTTNFTKERTEGWAFTAAILPQIHNCSASAAERIRANLFLKAAPYLKDGAAAILTDFQSVYKCLGISCADVGEMTEGSPVPQVVFPICSDETALRAP